MLIHLSTVLPAAFLATLQFTPFIRHNFRLYHRIAGYVIVVLITCGNAGAIMVATHAMVRTFWNESFLW